MITIIMSSAQTMVNKFMITLTGMSRSLSSIVERIPDIVGIPKVRSGITEQLNAAASLQQQDDPTLERKSKNFLTNKYGYSNYISGASSEVAPTIEHQYKSNTKPAPEANTPSVLLVAWPPRKG